MKHKMFGMYFGREDAEIIAKTEVYGKEHYVVRYKEIDFVELISKQRGQKYLPELVKAYEQRKQNDENIPPEGMEMDQDE